MSNLAGIDLGTTFSAIAILNDIGKAEIVPNAEGERITPSAIYFDDADSSIIRVGIEAVNSRHLNPDRSVRWIKRHIGEADYRVNIDGKEWTPEELSRGQQATFLAPPSNPSPNRTIPPPRRPRASRGA